MHKIVSAVLMKKRQSLWKHYKGFNTSLAPKTKATPQDPQEAMDAGYQMGLKEGWGEGLAEGVGLGMDVSLEAVHEAVSTEPFDFD